MFPFTLFCLAIFRRRRFWVRYSSSVLLSSENSDEDEELPVSELQLVSAIFESLVCSEVVVSCVYNSAFYWLNSGFPPFTVEDITLSALQCLLFFLFKNRFLVLFVNVVVSPFSNKPI